MDNDSHSSSSPSSYQPRKRKRDEFGLLDGTMEDELDGESSPEFSFEDGGEDVSKSQQWTWNSCFVHGCKKYSDRYLKDLKDGNVIFVHTCASHRTMQEKLKKAHRSSDIICNICYGINESDEIFTCFIPSTKREFRVCKVCKNMQDNICAETVINTKSKKARGEAQALKKELWTGLTRSIRTDSLASPVHGSLYNTHSHYSSHPASYHIGSSPSRPAGLGMHLSFSPSPSPLSSPSSSSPPCLLTEGQKAKLKELIIAKGTQLFPPKPQPSLREKSEPSLDGVADHKELEDGSDDSGT